MTQPYDRSQELPSATSKAPDVKQVSEKPARSKQPSASSQQYSMEHLKAIFEGRFPFESRIKGPQQTQQNLVLIGHQSVIRSFEKPTT